jgi:putative transposase
MNSTCERFLGSVRREALDHIVILSERHLKSVLSEYVGYHGTMRPHQGLGQRIPTSTPQRICTDASEVVAVPVLGGLHHGYRAAA